MIPLIDDYLQSMVASKLSWLKKNPIVLKHLFKTGKRETLEKLEKFIRDSKLRVTLGYPQTPSSLPAFVIVLAPENEQPAGLGDNTGIYELFNPENKAGKEINRNISGTYMNTSYRIECWSDNGDLTAYMYTILKWCLLVSRMDMLELGWTNITISGTDLEPSPDYLPVFIYRRTLQLSLTYEAYYHDRLDGLSELADILENPENYTEDDNGNIINSEGNVVLDKDSTYVLRPHYYKESVESQD